MPSDIFFADMTDQQTASYYSRKQRELQAACTREVERKRKLKTLAVALLESLHAEYILGEYAPTRNGNLTNSLGFQIQDAIQEIKDFYE